MLTLIRARLSKPLIWLVVLYAFASLGHFAHNAEHLAEYPNLPDWLSRALIYRAWVGITAVGVVGVVLHHTGRQRLALVALGVYAAIGFDGLLHYTQAPFAAHTTAMNASIWFEAVAAAALLGAVVAETRARFRAT